LLNDVIINALLLNVAMLNVAWMNVVKPKCHCADGCNGCNVECSYAECQHAH